MIAYERFYKVDHVATCRSLSSSLLFGVLLEMS